MAKQLIAFALLLTAIFFLYQRDQQNTTEFSGIAMTVPYRVVIGQSLSSEQISQVQQIIDQGFEEVDNHYNQWNPFSEAWLLNALPSHTPHHLSNEMLSFLTLIDKLVTLTEGRFDPTIEPLRRLWRPSLEQGITPSADEIARLRPSIGWSHVHFSDGVFYKDADDVQLNFDAFAKGYAVDIITLQLKRAGYLSAFIDWGGEIRTSGKHPENRPWRVYISGLDSSDIESALAVVNLEDSALATSGDYHQHWAVVCPDGSFKTYCHVLNPLTLWPQEVNANSIASASVMCESCAVADALATATMLFDDPFKAKEWAESIQDIYPSLNFWIVNRI